LDDWIYCTLYIHTTRDYRQCSAIAILHTFHFTVTHALGFSVVTSRILATDLSQSHCNFKSHMKSSLRSLIPFLPLFCECQFRRLDSIQFLCSQTHTLVGWRVETRLYSSTRLGRVFWLSFYNPSARATQKKQPVLLRRRVYWSVAYQWTSFCCTRALRENVFTESLPSNGYTCHNIKHLNKHAFVLHTRTMRREPTRQGVSWKYNRVTDEKRLW
jgi:hypothetical protein